MVDFLIIATRPTKRGVLEIYPKFVIKRSSDLMVKGGDFYAIWIEERGFWSIDEQDALQLIDNLLDKYAEENRHRFDSDIKVLHMWDAESGLIDSWHKYCQKQLRDHFHMLDEKLIFSNTPSSKKDYASKKLSYPLECGDHSAYDTLMSTLYSKEERCKIEWSIGSIVCGESKKLQKFVVLYGAPGSGKGTVINMIQELFEGYYAVFDAKALGSSNNAFALESFKTNPLVAIQHDGDLSKIEDNTRLNSLVSHEMMSVNEKYKPTYGNKFKSFLFMGTNKPVKITDAKSGMIRRLIDVSPSGNKLSQQEYKTVVSRISFELGAIAYHCQEVYLNNPGMYDDYVPISMFGASNDFYNFVLDSYHIFKSEGGTTLKAAWELYKNHCEDAKVAFPFPQRAFKEELKNYFLEYKERFNLDDGNRVRSYYEGFKSEKFEYQANEKEVPANSDLIQFDCLKSIFDVECADCLAQYANAQDIPIKKWDVVTSVLSELDTSKTHYVKVPENHIVIDFDITDEKGKKSLERNIAEASKWPLTYAELSKSGMGVHLHYIYTGDVTKLSRVYDDHIEVKVFSGKSTLRRKLTSCNGLPTSMISSGLPLKGDSKMVNSEAIKSEKGLRTQLKRNLNKEIHAGTKSSIDFICKILDDAYKSDICYDVTDMRPAILAFAVDSTNQAPYCIKLVSKMKFKSEEYSAPAIDKKDAHDTSDIVFYDVEVFPNLFICNYKQIGEGNKVVRLINPKPSEIEELLKYKLVGFNCRRYDNHIMYAAMMGYNNKALYVLSQRIINKSPNCFFGEAYNLSYTDVYDFSIKKQSLKKFEIELGIIHKELGLPWDQPVPENLWIKVAEYCDNDVIATEAVFNARKSDFTARLILAELAGMTPNDPTNTLTTRIIFGNNKKPQDQFNWRDMGLMTPDASPVVVTDDMTLYSQYGDEYTVFDKKGRPIFPGYEFKNGKSTYRGEEVGEGGYVYSEPGIHVNVALLDITAMHPHSIIAECTFGEVYTRIFKEVLDARVAIKHHDYEYACTLLNGLFAKYLTDPDIVADLPDALKLAINSVYGLTAAHFDNPFRDPRNVDNIVAKRGALFMVNLKHEVQKRGFTVAHIKTDSIKIPNATEEIIKFVFDYGKQYGYYFEHEATYAKMCLVNDAVYVSKYNADGIKNKGGKHANEWNATGTQFQVPYVFKTLFTREEVVFEDLCETKAVTSALYLDTNEDLPDVTKYENDLVNWKKKWVDSTGIISGAPMDEYEYLTAEIAKGHCYHFVGRVGRFCPIKPGYGGGLLARETISKIPTEQTFGSATGAKGYRWLESENVKGIKDESIDISYYNALVDDAVSSISQYGDFEWFISNDEIKPVRNDATGPCDICGHTMLSSCFDCPKFHIQDDILICDLGYDFSNVLLPF